MFVAFTNSGLQNEAGRDPLTSSSGNLKKILPPFQPGDDTFHGQSRGQALTTLRPPAGQNLAAPKRCHASAKSVPTLAYQFARLVGAFHGSTPKETGPAV